MPPASCCWAASRAFSSLEAQNPLADALVWTVTIFGAAPAHATVQTQADDVEQDLTVALP